MEVDRLCCVVCLRKCKRVSEMKEHLISREHTQKMSQVFQKVFFHFPGFFPQIKTWVLHNNFHQPVLGLSLLTLCFSADTQPVFYLCHACEEKVPPEAINSHMHSQNHISNYYNFTDPKRFGFCWLPHKELRINFSMKKEASQCSTSMQLLDLPDKLWAQFQESTYFEVMSHIDEKLPNHIKALSLPRVEIEVYQNNMEKEHPLLGLRHIVEVTTAGETKKFYLCTLCKLSFPNQQIFKHVLSFDHVFSYFAAWHPSSLMPKEFYATYDEAFRATMLDLSKKTLDIHGCGQIRQLRLEPDVFESVKFSSYDQALAELESIAKETNELSLVVDIIPGNNLAHVQPCKIHCQNCNMAFHSERLYLEHVNSAGHLKMRSLLLGKEKMEDNFNHTNSSLARVLKVDKRIHERTPGNKPTIGTSLVMLCVSCKVDLEHIFICFACEHVAMEVLLPSHLESEEHLISTLMYYNPCRLPFGWRDRVNVPVLKDMVLVEEQRRGPMLLKVLEMPRKRFRFFLTLDYKKLMRQLTACDSSFKSRGLQFIVKYFVGFTPRAVKFVCLLCKKKVPTVAWRSHVISSEHIVSFLKIFHPGSVTSRTTDVEILDLAEQSTAFHPIAEIREVKLSRPIRNIEKCPYLELIQVLKANNKPPKKRLIPPIIQQVKLVPRKCDKIENTSHIVESPAESTHQKSLDELDTEEERNTRSISTSEHLHQKASKSKPLSEAAGSEEKMGQENEVVLKREKPAGQQSASHENNRSQKEELKAGEKMTNHSLGTRDVQLGSAALKRRGNVCEGSPQERSKRQRHASETTPCKESEKTTKDDVSRRSPVIASDKGVLLNPHGISDCSSQNNMVDERKDFGPKQVASSHLAAKKYPNTNHQSLSDNPFVKDAGAAGQSNVCLTESIRGMESSNVQEPVYWPRIPAQSRNPQVPSAVSALNPNAATCQKGSSNCKTDAALNVKMPETRRNNMAVPASVSSRKANVDAAYHRNIPPVSPQAPPPKYIKPVQRSLSTDQSNLNGRKSNKDKRPPRVGLSYIITVVCGDKQQVYCQLCSIRLNHSTHLSSYDHQRKYVKTRRPSWNDTSKDENQLAKMVTELIDMDKDKCSSDQRVEVGYEVYQNLAVLPEEKAIHALRQILSERRKPTSSSVSPYLDDVSSPRRPSAKDIGLKTPGTLQRRSSSSSANLTKDSQRPLEVPGYSPAGLSNANQMKDRQKPLEAPEKSSGFSSTYQSLIKNGQKPHERHEKSPAAFSSANPLTDPQKPVEVPPSVGFPNANETLTKDRQKPLETSAKSSTGISISSHSVMKDGHKPHEVTKNSSSGFPSANHSLIEDSQKRHERSEKSPSGFSRANSSLTKDLQKPHEAPEKSLSGFSRANSSLTKDLQKPHEAPEKSPSGFSRANSSLTKDLQKPHEAPEKSPSGFSRANSSLTKDLQKPHEAPEKFPSGFSGANSSLMKDLQKPLEAPEKSPTGFSNGDIPRQPLTPLQQYLNEQQMPKHPPLEPGRPGSERLTDEGEVPQNDLFSLLTKNDVKPIIGLALIWECQVTPDSTAVYLCESCGTQMLFEGLCQHMVSIEHQLNYMMKEYRHFMNFLFKEDLQLWMKEEILRDVARMLADRERHLRKDAQMIRLSQVLYKKVKEEPFSDALRIVQHCKKTTSSY